MKKIELLSPAGDLERLKVTLLYGADAVYLGGKLYNLRANATNFSLVLMLYIWVVKSMDLGLMQLISLLMR